MSARLGSWEFPLRLVSGRLGLDVGLPPARAELRAAGSCYPRLELELRVPRSSLAVARWARRLRWLLGARVVAGSMRRCPGGARRAAGEVSVTRLFT